ncbi:MAG: methyl-coenzyme M reductase operon protein D [Methanospirillum sp.]|uniref:methyl-coenzyme M reductase operon protein D n=1 Tax=Methanospirillum sp. TaxID=45200 RepID=UPI00236EE82F|nr:methyl-coenzyme M reductase operon protein D [Methanospirillum sp.]MDD1727696.1 methyl-coenzyme M reductase operon protein D [Methanospirillum sp.]
MCDESSATQATYPQIKIVSIRMMKPETTEKLLNLVVKVPGVRRILLRGQNIPKTVPYGPARGIENKTNFKTGVSVAGTDVDIRLMVGDVILELEEPSVADRIKETCDEFFTNFGFYIQKGTFIKPSPSMVDYAKYGPNVEPELVGMLDPKRKDRMVLLGRHSERSGLANACENNMLEG